MIAENIITLTFEFNNKKYEMYYDKDLEKLHVCLHENSTTMLIQSLAIDCSVSFLPIDKAIEFTIEALRSEVIGLNIEEIQLICFQDCSLKAVEHFYTAVNNNLESMINGDSDADEEDEEDGSSIYDVKESLPIYNVVMPLHCVPSLFASVDETVESLYDGHLNKIVVYTPYITDEGYAKNDIKISVEDTLDRINNVFVEDTFIHVEYHTQFIQDINDSDDELERWIEFVYRGKMDKLHIARECKTNPIIAIADSDKLCEFVLSLSNIIDINLYPQQHELVLS